MKETDIRKYAELMKELELTGLEITDENSKVRLERSVSRSAKETVYSVPESAANIHTIPEAKDYISVKSPIVGVFYAAPAENADPYISIGDDVKKGQILCIVEAMKLMNEIIAEEDGVISEICVTNGQVVEYGTELFRIKR
ncbi:acetyl-CoA carboxylase biotin carboxyl carrier protein [Mediterraneibacter agrestimuris]|uniref:acetyl-CoA carboxylase biotin carboxyl carrier protein n=1 Tax=Mediterraneibacter agrestimuris TaxID=2941333 RepID=UPI00203CC905|nr:biotin/lipoyl-containing protein [Mediterraneibacter agrestimuris]